MINKEASEIIKTGGKIFRTLETVPFDKVFDVDGNEELCHATGYEALICGEWWNEYIDSTGYYHYGR